MAVDRVALLERIGLALARLGLAPPPLPVPFYDGYLGLLGARAVMAATRLGVIRALAERADDARGLARRLELDPDRLEVLLAALASLGYVRRRRDGRWAPTRMARRWLAPDGIDAIASARPPTGPPRWCGARSTATSASPSPGRCTRGRATPTVMAGVRLAITGNADPMSVVVLRRAARVRGAV